MYTKFINLFQLLFQQILNSSIHIDKNLEYDLLLPFIGTGLVTSSGKNNLKKIVYKIIIM